MDVALVRSGETDSVRDLPLPRFQLFNFLVEVLNDVDIDFANRYRRLTQSLVLRQLFLWTLHSQQSVC